MSLRGNVKIDDRQDELKRRSRLRPMNKLYPYDWRQWNLNKMKQMYEERGEILKYKTLYMRNESRDIRFNIDTRHYIKYEIWHRWGMTHNNLNII